MLFCVMGRRHFTSFASLLLSSGSEKLEDVVWCEKTIAKTNANNGLQKMWQKNLLFLLANGQKCGCKNSV